MLRMHTGSRAGGLAASLHQAFIRDLQEQTRGTNRSQRALQLRATARAWRELREGRQTELLAHDLLHNDLPSARRRIEETVTDLAARTCILGLLPSAAARIARETTRAA